MVFLFISVCGIITTWTDACLLRPSCYSLAALLVEKTYSLVSISLSIKNNVFGLTSKLFYCLAKCLISAEALHNSYFIAAPVTLLILTVSNYAQFILCDFLFKKKCVCVCMHVYKIVNKYICKNIWGKLYLGICPQ